MYTPVNETTPEFMKRYESVMKGDEVIDTAKKLKDFWLFAVREGWKRPETREYTAELAVETINQSPAIKLLRIDLKDPFKQLYETKVEFLLCAHIFTGETRPIKESDSEWKALEGMVKKINLEPTYQKQEMQ